MTDTLPRVALSVRQPWAWAIIHAGKDIENRSVAAVRHGMGLGPIAIHAAKGMTRDEYREAAQFMADIGVQCPQPEDLVRGAVIGSALVVDIVSHHSSPWFFGPRGLVLESPRAADPVAAVGALGYFEWKPGGEIDQPKPWMRALGRRIEPKPMELFGSE